MSKHAFNKARALEFVDQAQADEYQSRTQIVTLDNVLKGAANEIREQVSEFNEEVFECVRDDPEDQNEAITEALVRGEINPLFHMSLQLNADYLRGVTSAELTALAGYKKIHKVAQEMDVAVNLRNVLCEGEVATGRTPFMEVNVAMTYEEGAMQSTYGYPQLEAEEAKAEEKAPVAVEAKSEAPASAPPKKKAEKFKL